MATTSKTVSSDDNKTQSNGGNKKMGTTAAQPSPTTPSAFNNENVMIFRRAVGINYELPSHADTKLEEGRKSAIGIYREVLQEKQARKRFFWAINLTVYFSHFAQIIVGASLTALGPSANRFSTEITVLGAVNTVIAGVLALLNGQGLPDRLRKDEVEFQKIQDWIEETESLLAVGIIGSNRADVGQLVETAFKKFNAAKATKENNKPSSYITQSEEGPKSGAAAGGADGAEEDASTSSGNAAVKLNLPGVH
jgi:hypothetical protein